MVNGGQVTSEIEATNEPTDGIRGRTNHESHTCHGAGTLRKGHPHDRANLGYQRTTEPRGDIGSLYRTVYIANTGCCATPVSTFTTTASLSKKQKNATTAREFIELMMFC